MTTAQRLRRVVFWALTGGALARLYVLGEERTWRVVAPIAATVTALTVTAWLLHLAWHELGHLVVARRMRFEVDRLSLGPLEWSADERRWRWGRPTLRGALATLPIGADDLRRRLKLVALGGPLASLLATAALALAWQHTGAPLTSALGVGWVTGVLVLVSAATPGRFREATAIAGNDVDQVLGGRAIVAYWTALAVVQGVRAGRRAAAVLEDIALEPLLPPSEAPPEPVTVLAAVAHLERGDPAAAKALLLAARPHAHEATLAWVSTDVLHQLGALLALHEGDPDGAATCLVEVRRTQTLPWYGDLLEACVAKASGDDELAARRLDGWLEHARATPRGRLACGGNEWILDALRPGWTLPMPASDGA
ncbi:MAG: hypothetical protein INH41_18460 [Myxococcaceae bacterium]|nr:hypothetical protein [Myxococcaceae bacterium]MCA3014370.1 hypothetical protein [Myxococcaceae bacterium]